MDNTEQKPLTAESVIRQPKYKTLKNLWLIIEAMEEHTSQQTEALQKEVERLKEEKNEIANNANMYIKKLEEKIRIMEDQRNRY
jgi:transcriptional regulator with AAA-type ATPase domain